MKKNELIARVASDAGCSQDVARSVLDAAADAAREALSEGSEVFLFGLGKLVVSSRGEKKARNIRTGEPVIVPPRRAAVFKASTSVERALNGPAA
jgi:DNA-binding protein HU-beta